MTGRQRTGQMPVTLSGIVLRYSSTGQDKTCAMSVTQLVWSGAGSGKRSDTMGRDTHHVGEGAGVSDETPHDASRLDVHDVHREVVERRGQHPAATRGETRRQRTCVGQTRARRNACAARNTCAQQHVYRATCVCCAQNDFQHLNTTKAHSATHVALRSSTDQVKSEYFCA